MRLVYLVIGLGLVLVFVAIYLILLSRHKKSATGAINLIGATGVVQTSLDPDGAVLIEGELWQARTRDGSHLPEHVRIRVLGVTGPLLLVEPAPFQSPGTEKLRLG